MKCNVYVKRETGEFLEGEVDEVAEEEKAGRGLDAGEGLASRVRRGRRHELTEKGLNVYRGSSEILA